MTIAAHPKAAGAALLRTISQPNAASPIGRKVAAPAYQPFSMNCASGTALVAMAVASAGLDARSIAAAESPRASPIAPTNTRSSPVRANPNPLMIAKASSQPRRSEYTRAPTMALTAPAAIIPAMPAV